MRLFTLVLFSAAVVGAAQTAQAQYAGDELADLRTRIEALGRENQQLQQTLIERLPPPGAMIEPTGAGYDQNTTQFTSAAVAAPEVAGVDAADAATEVGSDLTMSARWNNGLELATKDKAFRVHVGGRWQLDTSWLTAEPEVQDNLPGDVRYHDGLDFRRARLRIDGMMYEVIEFAMEYDFVNGLRARTGDTAKRSEAPKPGRCTRGMSLSPAIGTTGMSSQRASHGGKARLSGWRICRASWC